uniref:SFRICE_017568 n=1 Tax=Spodoptera frugiperda TaxID=7108 RepID=A0A2H1WJD0_SPOFR
MLTRCSFTNSLLHAAYKWPLLAKGLFSHGQGLNINHHACTMWVGDFKIVIRNYKPSFPHDVFHHRLSVVLKLVEFLVKQLRK